MVMRLWLVVSLSLISVTAWGSPVAPIEVTLTQPDGTRFKARPRGDEYGDWMETLDGRTIVQKDGEWFYAVAGPDGSVAASTASVNSVFGKALDMYPKHLHVPVAPSVREVYLPRKLGAPLGTGLTHTQYVLTILVDFTDTSFTYTASSFQSLVYGASSSVKDFYLENSYNNFTVTPATESYGTANDGIIEVSMAYVHPDFGNNWSDPNRAKLVRDAISAADPYISYSSYDSDADNSVSASELAIFIIPAGYEASYGGATYAKTPNVWGHMSSASAGPHDTVYLGPYAMAGEVHGRTDFGSDHQATIGVMCHELGHLMLGLPDLYDTDYSSEGIGEWGVMSSGNWNKTGTYQGDCPAHFSAYCKAVTDLVTPTDIDTAVTSESILSGSHTASIKRLWIDKYKSPTREYFLVENRQKAGYDTGLPGDGLANMARRRVGGRRRSARCMGHLPAARDMVSRRGYLGDRRCRDGIR